MQLPIRAGSKEHVAYHEAGHAVVAHRLGLEVTKLQLTVGPNGWYGTTSRRTGHQHERQTAACGGHVAEWLLWKDNGLVDSMGQPLSGPQFFNLSLESAHNDKAVFFGVRANPSIRWSPQHNEEFVRFAAAHAGPILHAERPSLMAVAKALVANGMLDKDQFDRIMSPQAPPITPSGSSPPEAPSSQPSGLWAWLVRKAAAWGARVKGAR